jgi:hypothetical protein
MMPDKDGRWVRYISRGRLEFKGQGQKMPTELAYDLIGLAFVISVVLVIVCYVIQFRTVSHDMKPVQKRTRCRHCGLVNPPGNAKCAYCWAPLSA